MKPETKVGLFTVMGIALFGLSVYMLGNISVGGEYKINAEFKDVSGLPNKSVIKLNGVDAGKVRSIKISADRVVVTLGVRDGVRIYKDSVFKIGSTSLIGSKYMAVTQGTPGAGVLKDGDTVNGFNEVPLEQMLSQTMDSVKSLVDSVNGNGSLGRDLNAALSNIRTLSANLNELVVTLQPFLEKSMSDISQTTSNLKDLMARADDITRQIQESEGVLGSLINDPQMKADVKESVSNLKITMGEAKDFIGKMTRFRVFWLYDGYYNATSGVLSNNVGLKIYPSNDYMYYRVGISNIGNVDNLQKSDDYMEKNGWDARLGFYNNYLDVSAGYVMGAGGVAVEAYPFYGVPFAEKFGFQGQFTDFGRDRIINGRLFNKANVLYGATFEVSKYITVGAGMMDALELNDPYIRASFRFQDKDIAAFFGLATLAK